jgi:VWA domain containing CoxE-like protein
LSAVELADFPAFARTAIRTRWLRRGFALLAVVLAFVAALAAPRQATPAADLLPAGANGIAVVDVSASISWETYARIASTLDRLRRGGGRAGLVLFSDTAYQALPPGTPVSELRGFERFFVVARPRSAGLQPQPPRSPWTESFSAGTRISTGLALALQAIREQHLRRPVVLLVSDLDDDAGDLESLTSVALAYRRLGIPIRVVGLNPSPEDVRLVERLLPQGGSVLQSALPGERRDGASSPVPGRVLAAAIALSLTLALFLALTERLRWSRA